MNDITVYKSNSLVQAGYKLSVNEQRIILHSIGQLNSTESVTDEIMYCIPLHELMEQGEIKNGYTEFREAAIRLAHRKVRIAEPNSSSKDRIVLASWVQTIAYSDNNGIIELRFSKDILPYLTQLKEHFTKYKLKHVAKMKSSYGIRLYELIVQKRDFGSRDIEIVWLRKQFQLGENEYTRMYDLKKRVIDPAVKDINESSDLWVKYTQRKTGRRVTHFTFEFGSKNRTDTPKTRNKKLTKKFIENNALPGESWENAKERLTKISEN